MRYKRNKKYLEMNIVTLVFSSQLYFSAEKKLYYDLTITESECING